MALSEKAPNPPSAGFDPYQERPRLAKPGRPERADFVYEALSEKTPELESQPTPRWPVSHTTMPTTPTLETDLLSAAIVVSISLSSLIKDHSFQNRWHEHKTRGHQDRIHVRHTRNCVVDPMALLPVVIVDQSIGRQATSSNCKD